MSQESSENVTVVDIENVTEKKEQKPNIHKRHFKHYWVDKFPWLMPGETETSQAICKLCDCKMQLRVSSFEQHQNSKKHQNKLTTAYKKSISSPCKTIKMFSNSYPSTILKNTKETEKRIVAPDGTLILVKSEANLVGLNGEEESLSDFRLKRIANEVSNQFAKDLKKSMTKNGSLLSALTKNNSSFSFGDPGLERLKKLFVGHMAQQYLLDTTIGLWKKTSAQVSLQTKLTSQIETIALQIDRSVHEMDYVKANLQDIDEMDPNTEV